jgi:RNA polymerase sigma factor (sigma-70 family)
MEQLKREYRAAIRQLETLRDNMDEQQRKTEGPIVGSMISDLRYALEWMNSGRRPGNRRGAERLAAYQREKPVDPIWMQKYIRGLSDDPFTQIDGVRSDEMTMADRERLDDALSVLTEREKEVYLMARGHCLSYAEIARYLDIGKSTVQTMVERAEKKITERINESLFCWCG